MSWRKLLVLVDNLPPEGALNTAIRNATPEHILAQASGDLARAPWSMIEMLLATLIDEVRMSNWLYVSAHSQSGSNIRQPEPIKRPGGGRRRGRKLMRVSDVRALDPRLKDMSDQEIVDLMSGRSPSARGDIA